MAATLLGPRQRGCRAQPGAALLDFPGYRAAARIEVITRHGSSNRSPFAERARDDHGRRRFVVVQGIRVVSPADCLVQLAPPPRRRRASATLLDDVARTTAPRSSRSCATSTSNVARVAPRRASATLREALQQRGDGYVPAAGELERLLRARHGVGAGAAGGRLGGHAAVARARRRARRRRSSPTGARRSRPTAGPGTPGSPTSSAIVSGTPSRWRTATRTAAVHVAPARAPPRRGAATSCRRRRRIVSAQMAA